MSLAASIPRKAVLLSHAVVFCTSMLPMLQSTRRQSDFVTESPLSRETVYGIMESYISVIMNNANSVGSQAGMSPHALDVCGIFATICNPNVGRRLAVWPNNYLGRVVMAYLSPTYVYLSNSR